MAAVFFLLFFKALKIMLNMQDLKITFMVSYTTLLCRCYVYT